MGHTPDLLILVGREQTIVDCVSYLDHGSGDAFPEALLVADLFEERGRSYEDDLGT